MTDPGNTLELFPLDDTQHLHDPSSARSDVRIGEAGELLTVSKLLKWGVKAFTVAAGDQYDILADVGGTSNSGQNIFGSQVQLQFWLSQRLLLFT